MLSTASLAMLFGDFVTARLTETLIENHVFCTSAAHCKSVLSSWRIIAQGDFNDELGELYDIQLFGKRVHQEEFTRMRTCCSDRDEYWTIPYEGEVFENYTIDPLGDGTFQPTPSTWSYLLQDCKYEGDCVAATEECELAFKQNCPNAIMGADFTGAKRPAGAKGGEFSRYPFASDLILDTEDVLDFGFPINYVQSAQGAMSDHDPVRAKLAPLDTASSGRSYSIWFIATLVLSALLVVFVSVGCMLGFLNVSDRHSRRNLLVDDVASGDSDEDSGSGSSEQSLFTVRA